MKKEQGEHKKQQTLFTVGPVMMFPSTLRLGGTQVPYFRTPEFTTTVLDCEQSLILLADAAIGSRAVFLTASGTGAMEAAIINTLSPNDRALIIVGGTFGARFCEICKDAAIAFDAIELEPGASFDPEMLKAYDLSQYSALLVNAHETSTGVRYDIAALGAICRANGLLFIVDAISAFLCDPISMISMGIDVLIVSSQKALALAPGLSMLLLSPRAIEIVERAHVSSYYFGLKKYLQDGARGQTPFTPAVGVLMQLLDRLDALKAIGASALVDQCHARANYFRHAIEGLPYAIFAQTPSNALTALSPQKEGLAQDGQQEQKARSTYAIYEILKNDYGLVVTPNGGALKDTVFRVGHMGNLTKKDFSILAAALREIAE